MRLEIENGVLNLDRVDGVKSGGTFGWGLVTWVLIIPISILFGVLQSSFVIGFIIFVVAFSYVLFQENSVCVQVLKDGKWHKLKGLPWHKARKLEKEISQNLLSGT